MLSKTTSITKNAECLTVSVLVRDGGTLLESYVYDFPVSIFPPEVAMRIATEISSVNSYLAQRSEDSSGDVKGK